MHLPEEAREEEGAERSHPGWGLFGIGSTEGVEEVRSSSAGASETAAATWAAAEAPGRAAIGYFLDTWRLLYAGMAI